MKTNEAKIPWEPKPEDQSVDGKNYKGAKEQLVRDTLRFFELFPDIKTSDVECHFAVAFPLASRVEGKEDVLTEEDFLEEHLGSLLSKLGIDSFVESPTTKMEETYLKIVARYLGQHSQLPSKNGSEALANGLEALELATQSADSVFETVVNETKLEKDNSPFSM